MLVISLLVYDVALEVELDVDLLAALRGGAGPDAVVVLFQVGNVGIAVGLNLRLGLALGEAVCARNWRRRVVGVWRFDCGGLRKGASRNRECGNECQKTHSVLLLFKANPNSVSQQTFQPEHFL